MLSWNELDRRLLKWAYQMPYKNSLPVKILIFTGDAVFWLISLLFFALAAQFLDSEPLRELVIKLYIGSTIAVIIFFIFKDKVKRRRPYANEELQKDLNLKIESRDIWFAAKERESFPSGHVLWTSISIILICFQFGWLYVALLGWVIPAMIYLRPHLGVHYPTDVLASFGLAVVIVAVTMLISPSVMEFINSVKTYFFYPVIYWAFIIGYAIVGVKLWLKRI